MPFAPPVAQQCEVLSCSYAFHSEVPSQTRPLRLQLLITAGQLSRLWGEGREKRAHSWLNRRRGVGPPSPPGTDVRVVFYLFFACCRLLCVASPPWEELKLASAHSEREPVSAEPPLGSLLTLTFAVIEDSVWKHELRSKLFTHFLCPHKQVFGTIHLFRWLKVRSQHCSASAHVVSSFNVSVVKITRWRRTVSLDHFRKQCGKLFQLMWAFFHLSVGISPVCLLNTCVLACQPWWATCWPTSTLTSHTPPRRPQPRHPPLTDSLRLTLG